MMIMPRTLNRKLLADRCGPVKEFIVDPAPLIDNKNGTTFFAHLIFSL